MDSSVSTLSGLSAGFATGRSASHKSPFLAANRSFCAWLSLSASVIDLSLGELPSPPLLAVGARRTSRFRRTTRAATRLTLPPVAALLPVGGRSEYLMFASTST